MHGMNYRIINVSIVDLCYEHAVVQLNCCNNFCRVHTAKWVIFYSCDIYYVKSKRSFFQSYDPKKGKWMRLLQMPTKRAGTCAVAVGNKIVAMGGVAVDQKPLDVVEAYDISSKKWETKESLKEHLLGLSAVVRGL